MIKARFAKHILAVPMVLFACYQAGCAATNTTIGAGETKMNYDYKMASTADKAVIKNGNVYSYDLGGVSVLSTFDIQGGEASGSFIPALPNQCDGDNNVFMIKKGDEYILIDSGYGDKNPNSAVKANYEAFGVDMSKLSTIIMTHLHPDHAAGLTNGSPSILNGSPTKKYADAKIYLPKKDLEFWTQAELKTGVASELYYTKLDWASNNTFFAFGSSIVKDMVTSYGANVIAFEENSNANIAGKDFISKLNLFGHTPGHTAYIIKGADKTMIIAGDFVNCARAQFDNTSISAVYDFNFADAQKSREYLMKYATENALVVGSSHAPTPGFMTINKK